MRTALVWDELYMWHDTGHYAGILPPSTMIQPGEHFESPESKRRFKNLLDRSGLSKQLVFLDPIAATDEQILRVHSRVYLDKLESMSQSGGVAGVLTPFGAGSVEIAKLSAGAVITLVNAILDGKVDNGYSLNRPPGHHAVRDAGMGFCMLCNGAIAGRHLLEERHLERIAYVDWDVHHGNGTEAAFWTDPRALTISVHQDRCFPLDTGAVSANGEGAGKGYNINIPLPPGSGRGAYLAAFDRVVIPALHAYRPQMIIVPSGFDAGAMDPLGRMMLDSDVYRELTQRLFRAAAELCGGRIAFCHEGGYNPYSTPYAGLAVLETLLGVRTQFDDPFLPIMRAMGQQELQLHQDKAIAEAERLLVHL